MFLSVMFFQVTFVWQCFHSMCSFKLPCAINSSWQFWQGMVVNYAFSQIDLLHGHGYCDSSPYSWLLKISHNFGRNGLYVSMHFVIMQTKVVLMFQCFCTCKTIKAMPGLILPCSSWSICSIRPFRYIFYNLVTSVSLVNFDNLVNLINLVNFINLVNLAYLVNFINLVNLVNLINLINLVNLFNLVILAILVNLDIMDNLVDLVKLFNMYLYFDMLGIFGICRIFYFWNFFIFGIFGNFGIFGIFGILEIDFFLGGALVFCAF